MPQYPRSFVPYIPEIQSPTFTPYGNEPKEQSDLDWWIEQGLRTAPGVAGSILGGMTGFFGAGVGAIPGAMGGGAAGSALGNVLGNWWSGQDFSPARFGVDTALGAFPPLFTAGKLAANPGVREAAKYALKQTAAGGLEGGIQGLASVPAYKWADTGFLDATPEEYMSGGLAGSLFGGATGGGIGTIQGIRAANQPRLPIEANPPLPPGITPPPQAPPAPPAPPPGPFTRYPNQVVPPEAYGMIHQPQTLPGMEGFDPYKQFPAPEYVNPNPPPMPTRTGDLFTETIPDEPMPVQGELKFGPYRSRGRFTANPQPRESPMVGQWADQPLDLGPNPMDDPSLSMFGPQTPWTDEANAPRPGGTAPTPGQYGLPYEQAPDLVPGDPGFSTQRGGPLGIPQPGDFSPVPYDFTNPPPRTPPPPPPPSGAGGIPPGVPPAAGGVPPPVVPPTAPAQRPNGKGALARVLHAAGLPEDNIALILDQTDAENSPLKIVEKTSATVEFWKSRGYVELPIGATDKAYMIPAELAQGRLYNEDDGPVFQANDEDEAAELDRLFSKFTEEGIPVDPNAPPVNEFDDIGGELEPIDMPPEVAAMNPIDRIKRVASDFMAKLPLARSMTGRDVRFLTPNGTKLTHRGGGHDGGAADAGYSLASALENGIVRVSTGERYYAAEVRHPITLAQAQALADMQFDMKVPLTVEVNNRGDIRYTSKTFSEETSARELRDWINNVVKRNDDGPIRQAAGPTNTGTWGDEAEVLARQIEKYNNLPEIPGLQAGRRVVIEDGGKIFTPEDIAKLQQNPLIRELVTFYNETVNEILTKMGRTDLLDKVEGIGVTFDPRGHGLWIRNPESSGRGMLMVHPTSMYKKMAKSPLFTAIETVGTLKHEVAHIDVLHNPDRGKKRFNLSPEVQKTKAGFHVARLFAEEEKFYRKRSWDVHHGDAWLNRLGEIYELFDVDASWGATERLRGILERTKPGSNVAEIQELLQFVEKAGRRSNAQKRLLSGESTGGPTNRAYQEQVPDNSQPDGGRTPPGPKKDSVWRELLNFPRAITTIMDLSAALRQGLPMAYKKEWREAWTPMIKAGLDKDAYQEYMTRLSEKPMFYRPEHPVTGKKMKSWAEEAGLATTDINAPLSGREEHLGSKWAESGEFLGLMKMPRAEKFYQNTVGKVVGASNRSYSAFLNVLRANAFESLLTDAKRVFDADIAAGGSRAAKAKNPLTDLTYAKEIAEYVNNATGRGNLGKLESSAKLVSDLMFSPRLIAAHLRMLSPTNYLMGSPFVRKQYLKSAISIAGSWGTLASLAAMAGADVSMDPNSADFGKIKIGNTRLDPAGGFQQYIVALSRLISGRVTSSATGERKELGQGFRADTRGEVAQRFIGNKLQPVLKFANDLAFASQYQPFNVPDRALQLFIPLVVQDTIELVREDPKLLPLLAPVVAGMGTQTYSKGESVTKFIDLPKSQQFQGGSPW